MNTDSYIIAVDDDPVILSIYTIYLEKAGYKLKTAANGQEALQLFNQDPLSVLLIISDVQMPILDGYQLCEAIRNENRAEDVPFIFVSAHTTLEEKMKGYSAGGNDYVTKPASPQELIEKIKRLIEIREQTRSLNAQIKESFQTAMQAMTYSGHLGQIIEFFKSSMVAENLSDLTTMLFQYMDQHELHATILFSTPNGQLTFSNTGSVSPLEENVIELARSKGRFFDHGNRTIINYKDFSLLIKNMPTTDTERYGMLKDTLGAICEAVASRADTLINEDRQAKKESALAAIADMLDHVTQSLSSIQRQNLSAIEELMTDIESTMMTLGMTESQEKIILNIASDCLNKVDNSFDEGEKLKQKLGELQNKLTTLLK